MALPQLEGAQLSALWAPSFPSCLTVSLYVAAYVIAQERATAAGQAADLESYRQRCAALDAELKSLEEAAMNEGMD